MHPGLGKVEVQVRGCEIVSGPSSTCEASLLIGLPMSRAFS